MMRINHSLLLCSFLFSGWFFNQAQAQSPRFNHVFLVVEDTDRSVDFYSRAFNISDIRRIDQIIRNNPDGTRNEIEVNMALIKFSDQNFILEIGEATEMEIDNSKASYTHLGIDVENIEKKKSDILAAGATLLRDITLVEALDIKAQTAFFKGPDGETIELMQVLEGEF